MRRFIENKIAFAATVIAFALAMAVNARFTMEGAEPTNHPAPLLAFEDPTLPPPPWCDTCCPGCDSKKPDGVLAV